VAGAWRPTVVPGLARTLGLKMERRADSSSVSACRRERSSLDAAEPRTPQSRHRNILGTVATARRGDFDQNAPSTANSQGQGGVTERGRATPSLLLWNLSSLSGRRRQRRACIHLPCRRLEEKARQGYRRRAASQSGPPRKTSSACVLRHWPAKRPPRIEA
jgi:hypothetical protein